MDTVSRVVSTSMLRPAIALARRAGVDAYPIVARHGINRSDLDSDDVYRSATAVLRAWCDLAEASGDPIFGLRTAQDVRPDALAVLGGVLRLSNDLCELAERLSRFQRLLGDAWAMHFDRDAGRIRFRRAALVPAGEEKHLVERAAAIVTLELRRLSRTDIDPVSVSFRHEAPEDTSVHQAIFRAPIEFGTRSNELVYDATALRRPIEYGNADVARLLETVARAALAAFPRGDDIEWMDRVRRAVIDLLPDGAPTLRAISERLHASERTVQRFLASHHTSVRRVVDEVRRELASRHLASTSLSLDEIAFVIGFRDAGTFFRALRRWGTPNPAALRSTLKRARAARELATDPNASRDH